MSELISGTITTTPTNNKERPLDAVLKILPEEIPVECDPDVAPLNFYNWIVQRLVDNNVGLTPPDKSQAFEATDLMVFCGFEATGFKDSGTFGNRLETWGMKGWQFRSAAFLAEAAGEWPIHSPTWYSKNANNIEAVPETPAIAIFDSEKLSNLILKDKVRHEDEYELAEGYTMDDAVVAVVYLPK